LEKDPNFLIEDLGELETQIPNGEHMTDFRYAIGGFLMKQLYEKEGMQGLFDALQAGRTEEDYFRMLNEKLGFERDQFGSYVRSEIAKLKNLTSAEMEALKY